MATLGSHRMQPFTGRGRRERRRTKRDLWERCQEAAARAARNASRASPPGSGDASAARPIGDEMGSSAPCCSIENLFPEGFNSFAELTGTILPGLRQPLIFPLSVLNDRSQRD